MMLAAGLFGCCTHYTSQPHIRSHMPHGMSPQMASSLCTLGQVRDQVPEDATLAGWHFPLQLNYDSCGNSHRLWQVSTAIALSAKAASSTRQAKIAFCRSATKKPAKR